MNREKAFSLLLLIAGGVLLLYGLLPIVARLFGANLGSSIVSEVKLATDLNPWVEKLLLTAIGALATAIFLKFNFSLSWNKQLVGMGIIGAMWATTYGYLTWLTNDPIEGPWFNTDGTPLRCYVLEPQRVRLLYIVDRDPRTGARCIPVTEGMQHKLREWLIAQRAAEARGEKLVLRPVAAPAAFFGVNGDAIVWYYRKDDSTCEFFEIPGNHPEYRDELKAITKEAVAACKKAAAMVAKRLRDESDRVATLEAAATARKTAEQNRALETQRAHERAQAEAQAAQVTFEKYVGTTVSKSSAVVATLNLGDLEMTALDVVSQHAPTVKLRPSFATDGVFDAVWNGSDDLIKLGVGAARGIVMLRPASEPRRVRSSELQGLTLVRQEFSVLVIRPANAYAIQRHNFVAEGRAFGDAEARTELRADFAAKLGSLISAQF